MARPTSVSSDGRRTQQSFDVQAVDVTRTRAEELAAESIGVALAAGEIIDATAIAYRSEQHARALHASMARQQLDNYQLVPEIAATLEFLESTGEIQGYSTLAVYNLGSSGLSISVVDTETSGVLYAERTSEISGDYLDILIREQQIASGRLDHPQSAAEFAALDALCRNAKEQLSENTAIAVPTDGGLVLLTRENFETLVTLAVEASARLTRDVIMHSDQPVEAIVAIGGGARIPLVQNVLRNWMGIPVIVPEAPESVAARGAALLAKPVAPPRDEPQSIRPMWLAGAAPIPSQKREISGAGLAVSSLGVIAAIGLALGYGGQVLEIGSDSGGPTTTLPTPPPRTTTLEPSIAVAPVRTFAPTTTTTTVVVAVPPVPRVDVSSETPQPTPPTPPPPSLEIPGFPPILLPTIPRDLPTLPPPPPLPTLPPLPPPPTLPPLPWLP